MLSQPAAGKSDAAITNVWWNIQLMAVLFFKFLADVITLAAPLTEEALGMRMMARLTHTLYSFANLPFFASIKPHTLSPDFSYFDVIYHLL